MQADAHIATLVQRESRKVIASLVRLIGDVGAAEEALQDAFVQALEHWPTSGVPENPAAWLMVTARNRAVDALRRRRTVVDNMDLLVQHESARASFASEDVRVIPDDLLRLIFTCCHPVLARESQVALTLRLLGRLSTAEIARAFLIPEPTVAQRLVRAKRTLADARIPYEVPGARELAERLPAVLEVLYLIFNEGYTARTGERLLREDLCREAVRLAREVAELLPDQPEALGLAALLELQSSRVAARTDAEGGLVQLRHQDRSRWDRDAIARGVALLDRALPLARPGPYQLQAAIAACHAEARSWEETDWRQIAALYVRLARIAPSPVVELNRAVAVSMVEGPTAALAIVDAQADAPALRDYHLLPATRADFLRRLARWAEAAAEYRLAAGLTENQREREFLERQARQCEEVYRR